MSLATRCPDLQELERFLLGLNEEGAAGPLEEHVSRCPQCLAALATLHRGDPLVEAVRCQSAAVNEPDSPELQELIVRLERLRPLADPAEAVTLADGSLAAATPPQIDAPTLAPERSPVPSTPQELYDFLAPPQGPGELGRLGPYRVLEVLGSGGMGVVFRAEDIHLMRPVALKAMLPSLAASASARRRFLREARLAASIEHDHVVAVYQVGEDRELPFLAMPLLQGQSLDDRLQGQGKLPLAEVLRVGRETAEGLAAAHARGLIHRDVKPANIWLEGPRGRVKILDFGLARSVAEDGARLTQRGALVGTPAFMAPEQVDGQDVDGRCDLFSLGCVLYLMSTGQLPFAGKDTLATLLAVAQRDPPPPRQLVPALPAAFSDLVMQLLAKDPAQRPSSAAAVAEALGTLAADSTLLQTTTVRQAGPAGWLGTPLGGWAVKHPGAAVTLAGVALGVVVLLATLPFLNRGPGPSESNTSGVQVGNEPGGQVAREPEKYLTNSLGMKLVRLPAGQFLMGSSSGEISRALPLALEQWGVDGVKAEGPQHPVEITRPFYMGIHDVTVGQFRRFVTEANYGIDDAWQKPGWEQTEDHPVIHVSWHNAGDFCAWLSRREGRRYRLPTEAEWEYAARAGKSGTQYCFGDDETQLAQYAWYNANANGRAHAVGQLRPNDWGLHDMQGQVWEWCLDGYDPDYYKDGPKADPQGPGVREDRIFRGGAWDCDPVMCRCAFRGRGVAGLHDSRNGFRVVLLPALPGHAGPSQGQGEP